MYFLFLYLNIFIDINLLRLTLAPSHFFSGLLVLILQVNSAEYWSSEYPVSGFTVTVQNETATEEFTERSLIMKKVGILIPLHYYISLKSNWMSDNNEKYCGT